MKNLEIPKASDETINKLDKNFVDPQHKDEFDRIITQFELDNPKLFKVFPEVKEGWRESAWSQYKELIKNPYYDKGEAEKYIRANLIEKYKQTPVKEVVYKKPELVESDTTEQDLKKQFESQQIAEQTGSAFHSMLSDEEKELAFKQYVFYLEKNVNEKSIPEALADYIENLRKEDNKQKFKQAA